MLEKGRLDNLYFFPGRWAVICKPVQNWFSTDSLQMSAGLKTEWSPVSTGHLRWVMFVIDPHRESHLIKYPKPHNWQSTVNTGLMFLSVCRAAGGLV